MRGATHEEESWQTGGDRRNIFSSETTKIYFDHKVNHLPYLDFCVHFFSILHVYLSLYNLSVEIIRSLICLISRKTMTDLETLLSQLSLLVLFVCSSCDFKNNIAKF